MLTSSTCHTVLPRDAVKVPLRSVSSMLALLAFFDVYRTEDANWTWELADATHTFQRSSSKRPRRTRLKPIHVGWRRGWQTAAATASFSPPRLQMSQNVSNISSSLIFAACGATRFFFVLGCAVGWRSGWGGSQPFQSSGTTEVWSLPNARETIEDV